MLFRELKNGDVIVGDRVAVLDSEVRESLSEEVTFKQRFECHRVTNYVKILGKSMHEDSKCQKIGTCP